MIPVDRAHLLVAAITHPGMRRRENEDRYAVSAYQISHDDPTPSLLAVIADGVGGHRAGEVAAELAVEIVSQVVAAGDAGHPLSTLQDAFLQAGQAIYAQSMSDPDRQGMSTTCVCAWVIGDRLFISSVGDSRIYLERGSKIHRLTTDHTWVQEALDSGALTPEQARNHPNAHVIRRHLGSQAPVVPDLRLRLSQSETDAQAEANQGTPLLPGDNLLLCSDGLTDLVADGEILAALAKGDLQEAVQELVNLANARGGHDNLTLIGIQGPGRKPA
ncbi:MAG TPA: PP2C family serine/threonine-protein phosphatase, partial [Anaerolineales bacterium]|nr:PP2C family serine/threonine-protein phosphatase [Anaerolineales bacterium]